MPNFLSLFEKVEALVGFPNYSIGVDGPGQIVDDLNIYKHEGLDYFHFIPIYVDRGMSSIMLPEVNDYLLHFTDIEGEIMGMS